MKFKLKLKLFSKISALFKKTKELYKSKTDTGKFLVQFICFVFSYGLVINFALWQLLGLEISILKIIAWGIVFFFLNTEIPKIILSLRNIE